MERGGRVLVGHVEQPVDAAGVVREAVLGRHQVLDQGADIGMPVGLEGEQGGGGRHPVPPAWQRGRGPVLGVRRLEAEVPGPGHLEGGGGAGGGSGVDAGEERRRPGTWGTAPAAAPVAAGSDGTALAAGSAGFWVARPACTATPGGTAVGISRVLVRTLRMSILTGSRNWSDSR